MEIYIWANKMQYHGTLQEENPFQDFYSGVCILPSVDELEDPGHLNRQQAELVKTYLGDCYQSWLETWHASEGGKSTEYWGETGCLQIPNPQRHGVWFNDLGICLTYHAS